MRTKLRVTALLFLLAASPGLTAQQPGRIIRQLHDRESGRTLAGAQGFIPATARRRLGGIDCRYTLANVRAGQVDVTSVILGYSTKTVTGVTLPAGGTVRLDLVLTVAPIALEGITVS